ncbi:PREDICTED: serine/threonine-protein kinase HT1-like [Ipomoea nil]|uniref:serine/threonine-protein kinase HT1-like n=1 Tax=Ipomoea nil TaxID=35883 RepID=UPI00090124C8|nr:PREDICTED: serine/threonine-protein kinase HT1-like [Ipomoea nil]
MGNELSWLKGLYTQNESDDDDDDDESKFLIDETELYYGVQISQGVSTTVYFGTYMDKSVAIKVIETEKGTDESPQKERFLREVKLLAAAKHDNILKFIAYSVEPAMRLVTEMMTGGSLQRHLWHIKPATMDRKDALVMALEISRAMAYLHENGIIHRNLNPNNIFLSESKKSVKVGDFGLCREGLEGDFSTDVGSYRWMAPEVYSRELHGITSLTTRYNHKVDVYSFAFVVWEMFTNKTPFEDMDNKMIETAVMNNERPILEQEVIPLGIQTLLESCWSNDPQQRPEFSKISKLLEELLNQIEPGWDSIPASQPENLWGKISKRVCSCCHWIRIRLCCCCPSFHWIRTRLCCCCPSFRSIPKFLSSCCPSFRSIRNFLRKN